MKPHDLVKWRKDHNLTQEQLANLLGITKPSISMYESGKRKIPPFLHLALECLKVKKGGELKTREMKKRKEIKK
jgi:transcriptional regulator with XRE-family HTH domain